MHDDPMQGHPGASWNSKTGTTFRIWQKGTKACKQLPRLYQSEACKFGTVTSTLEPLYDPCNGPEDVLEIDLVGELPRSN